MKLIAPGAFVAFDDELIFLVVLLANGAEFGAVAGSAEGEVVEPLGVDPGGVGAAGCALGAPLALPGAQGDLFQRRLHAVDVPRDVALVAQNLKLVETPRSLVILFITSPNGLLPSNIILIL